MSDTGSEDGESPSGILKKQKNMKRMLLPAIVYHKRPFKLRFAEKRDIGRSYVSLVKPPGLSSTVASKFYAKQYSDGVTEQDVQSVFERINKMYIDRPRDKYKQPVLDSHNYGWHQGVSFGEMPRNDRRFCHGIRDSHLIKSQILILSTDAKTGKIPKK